MLLPRGAVVRQAAGGREFLLLRVPPFKQWTQATAVKVAEDQVEEGSWESVKSLATVDVRGAQQLAVHEEVNKVIRWAAERLAWGRGQAVELPWTQAR